jgi:hypothetical protein
MRATKHLPIRFKSVANNAAAAAMAARRQRFDRAFKRIELVGFTAHRHLKRFVVVVSAGFTFWHGFVWLRLSEGG